MSDYDALKTEGHSPAKAAEILLDAKRGDPWANKWIILIRDKHVQKDAP